MITLVHLADDWIGIYKDGQLLAQDHSFSEHQMLTLLGIEFEWVQLDADEDMSALPEKLEHIARA